MWFVCRILLGNKLCRDVLLGRFVKVCNALHLESVGYVKTAPPLKASTNQKKPKLLNLMSVSFIVARLHFAVAFEHVTCVLLMLWYHVSLSNRLHLLIAAFMNENTVCCWP